GSGNGARGCSPDAGEAQHIGDRGMRVEIEALAQLRMRGKVGFDRGGVQPGGRSRVGAGEGDAHLDVAAADGAAKVLGEIRLPRLALLRNLPARVEVALIAAFQGNSDADAGALAPRLGEAGHRSRRRGWSGATHGRGRVRVRAGCSAAGRRAPAGA